MQYKINPGDLGFLYGNCQRCYWLKVREGVNTPSRPIPNVIIALDRMIKEQITGKSLKTLGEQFPDGVVVYTGQKAISAPIKGSKGDISLQINGVFPVAYKLKDGSYGVAMIKTSEVLQEYIPFYWMQLQAYVAALEHSAADGLNLAPITEIGIISYAPNNMNGSTINGTFDWMDFDLDRKEFNDVLSDIMSTLRGDEPASEASCEWCRYRDKIVSEGKKLAGVA